MTNRDIMVLACKAVTIVFIVGVVTSGFLDNLAILFSANGWILMIVGSLCALTGKLLVIGVCILLWLKADVITKRFIPASTPENILLVDDSFAPSAIALAGIVICILSISSIFGREAQLLIYNQLEAPSMDINVIPLITALFQMSLGIGLFFGANCISQKLLTRIHSCKTYR